MRVLKAIFPARFSSVGSVLQYGVICVRSSMVLRLASVDSKPAVVPRVDPSLMGDAKKRYITTLPYGE